LVVSLIRLSWNGLSSWVAPFKKCLSTWNWNMSLNRRNRIIQNFTSGFFSDPHAKVIISYSGSLYLLMMREPDIGISLSSPSMVLSHRGLACRNHKFFQHAFWYSVIHFLLSKTSCSFSVLWISVLTSSPSLDRYANKEPYLPPCMKSEKKEKRHRLEFVQTLLNWKIFSENN